MARVADRVTERVADLGRALGDLGSRKPADVLGLLGRTRGGFVTCCCARFDPGGSVTLANAGNPSPYCEGVEVELESSLPLGITAEIVYAEISPRIDRPADSRPFSEME